VTHELFYATAATVTPVLLLVVFIQRGRADDHPLRIKRRWVFVLTLFAPLLAVLLMALGEVSAFLALLVGLDTQPLRLFAATSLSLGGAIVLLDSVSAGCDELIERAALTNPDWAKSAEAAKVWSLATAAAVSFAAIIVGGIFALN